MFRFNGYSGLGLPTGGGEQLGLGIADWIAGVGDQGGFSSSVIERLIELVLELRRHLGSVIKNVFGPDVLSLILLVKDTYIKT